MHGNLYFKVSHGWDYPIRVALAGPSLRASGPAWDPGELVPAKAVNFRLKYYAEPGFGGWAGVWTLSYKEDGGKGWCETEANTGLKLAQGAWELVWTFYGSKWTASMSYLGDEGK